MSALEFDELFQQVSNWGRWGPADERGTLNYITPSHIRTAASLVQSGRTVSMAIPINTTAGPDNPHPAAHYMAQAHDVVPDLGEPSFALDYMACAFHGDCHTHLDALCHVGYKGKLYNGKPASSVKSTGPTVMDITTYAQGIVGRGVLLDIPRLRGVKWLEPGEAVTREELEAAERDQRVRLSQGDFFLFYVGHHRRRVELGPWNCGYDGLGRAGLHPNAMPLLHERKVAGFLPDGDGETIPSHVDGVAAPIHALQIGAMGMVCADSLQFEELITACEEEARWEFMVVIAPLRFPRSTGSLINPIAIF
jgi:kynurenine formamidase